jgi:hypothetical protein
LNFRAFQTSRRRDGVASPRTSYSRLKTQRASGDGCVHPHGEKVVGGDWPQRQRKPPDPLRPCEKALNVLGDKNYARGLDHSGNIEGISNAIVPQSRWECTPWAAEATSILPAGPAACQRLASPVGSRQATGPRRRARPGRVAGDGQPARLGLGTYYKSSCNAGGAAAGSCWALAGSEKRVQKLVGLDHISLSRFMV